MNITFKSTSYDFTEEVRALIERKMEHVRRFVQDDVEAHLELEVEGLPGGQTDGARYRVEANLRVEGKFYRATMRSDSLEGAIEKVRHELEQELRKSQGRAHRMLKKGGARIKRMLRGFF